MGIYERDYYRDTRPSLNLHAPRTAIGVIVLLNVAFYLTDVLMKQLGVGPWLSNLLAVHGPGGQWPKAWPETLTHPWLWWQFVSYGFAHDPDDFSHILFNMLGLWFLGASVESLYGRKEFVWLYLVLLVVGSVVWAIIDRVWSSGGVHSVIGASGAIAGVVILFALNFPRQTLLLFFVLPVPAWVVGVMLVAYNMWGANQGPDSSNVAYTVHLAGAAFAFVYFQQRWNLGRLVQGRFSLPRFVRRPRLRVYEDEPEETPDDVLAEEVDRILAKIHREGESSLTRKERRTLESASREYQRRRRG